MRNITLSILISSLLSTTCMAGQLVNRVVAIVNDDVITQTELRQSIAMSHPQLANARGSLAYRKVEQQMIDALIDQRLLKREVERANIQLDDTELDTAYQTFLANNQLTDEQLKAALNAQNISMKQFRNNIATELKQMKFVGQAVGSNISMSDDEIAYAFKRTRRITDNETQYHVALITVPYTPDADRSVTRMESKHAKWVAKEARKKSFTAVAQKFSQAPSAADGGDLGFVDTKQLAPELAAALSTMHPGDVSAPIVTGHEMSIIKLVETRAVVHPQYAKVKPQLEQHVYQQKMSSALDQYVADLRSKAYIEVLDTRK